MTIKAQTGHRTAPEGSLCPAGLSEQLVNRALDLAGRTTGALQAIYTVELFDLGDEPQWHKDRALYGPWQRYELVARSMAGDELARVHGWDNADCWYRLAGQLKKEMHW